MLALFSDFSLFKFSLIAEKKKNYFVTLKLLFFRVHSQRITLARNFERSVFDLFHPVSTPSKEENFSRCITVF